jgi:Smg protein
MKRMMEGSASSPIFPAGTDRPAGSRELRHDDWNVTFRVLGPHERGRFAPEAWGHLLSLSGSGLVNPAELEQIIDRALLQFEGRIGLDDLRLLLDGSGLFDSRGSDDRQRVH